MLNVSDCAEGGLNDGKSVQKCQDDSLIKE